jgi:SsrA-binding protein
MTHPRGAWTVQRLEWRLSPSVCWRSAALLSPTLRCYSGLMAEKKKDDRKMISENRKARFEYFIEETYEAGIALTGTEVKSLRVANINIAESYASHENGGLFLINSYIPEYQKAGDHLQHSPRRPRQLLLKQKEIVKMAFAVEREGMTIVPLEMYFNARGRAKLKLGVAKGKKLADKRETSAKRDWARDKARLMRGKG